MQNLIDKQLFKQQCFINGQWLASQDGKTIAVTNPANGQIIANVPDMDEELAIKALQAAQDALAAWRSKTSKERSAILLKWFNLMLEHKDDLALLVTLEQGKPLVQAVGEIEYGASYLEWYAEEGKRVYGDILPPFRSDVRVLVQKQAIGVCAAITPWNFPSAMIARKLAPALAAGCTFVVRPASQTPLSAFAMAELSKRAGVPAGVFNVITGQARTIGKVLTEHEIVRKFSFTGSTSVGKLLMQQCATSIKKVSLELGGNAPFIVFDDADINEAVKGAVSSKFRNAGQTCVCANRIYVQRKVYEQFIGKFTAAVNNLVVGDGTKDGVDFGPLIDENAIAKVEQHIADALAKGASLVTGGKRHQLGGLFFEPTIVKDVTSQMLIAKEETFGPLAAIFVFDDETDVIKQANATEYGLASYVYSKDLARIIRLSEQLEYGMVAVNTGLLSSETAPFGGVKQSGIGREGSKYGIEDYLEIKYTLLSGIK